MRYSPAALLALLLFACVPARATVFATVRGVVHDPQHRPIASAHITLQEVESAFALKAWTNGEGEFTIAQVPLGNYRLEVQADGFAIREETITVASGTNPVIHIPLELASSSETVVVHAADGVDVANDTATPTTLITREDIETTPGASRTLGMQMITDYVPGAYMTHDMLHLRGGHQTSWLIDGVSIPNTKMSSNVGPQIDPKDIDEVETQRGSYSAAVCVSTYGLFNFLPWNGFERNHQDKFLLMAGNFFTCQSQLSFVDHS